MNVSVMCPSCREVLDIPSQYRGMDVRCAICQAVIPIPREPEPVSQRVSPKMVEAQRRSNLIVWVLLMMTFFVCSGIGLVMIGGMQLMLNPPMQTVTDVDHKFRVQVIGKPINIDMKRESLQIRGIECDNPERNERMWVRYYDIPLEDRKLEDLKLLETALETEAKAFGTKIQQATDTYDKLPCVDRIYERTQFPFKEVTIIRAIRAGNRVYILAIQGPQSQINPLFKHVRQFFLSFEITGE